MPYPDQVPTEESSRLTCDLRHHCRIYPALGYVDLFVLRLVQWN